MLVVWKVIARILLKYVSNYVYFQFPILLRLFEDDVVLHMK